MAEEDLFKKGFSESFEDIFDEDKFNERQKYATFIFWVAVVVEVFASYWFFFATSTGIMHMTKFLKKKEPHQH